MPIHAEFMAMMPGGNVRVAAGENVRIDANRGGYFLAARFHVARSFVEKNLEFGFGFDVEEQDSAARAFAGIANRFADFFAGFADAGENNAAAGNGDTAQAVQLSARDDIEAAAQAGEDLQHGEIGIGFCGVTQHVRKFSEGTIEAAVGLFDAGAAVDVGRGSGCFCDFVERDIFAMKIFATACCGAIGEKGRVLRGIEVRFHRVACQQNVLGYEFIWQSSYKLSAENLCRCPWGVTFVDFIPKRAIDLDFLGRGAEAMSSPAGCSEQLRRPGRKGSSFRIRRNRRDS